MRHRRTPGVEGLEGRRLLAGSVGMTPIHPLHPAPHVAVGPATAATHAATVHGSATGKAKHAHPSPPAAGFTREFDQLLQQERQQMSRSLQNQLAADRRLFRSLSRL